MVINLQFFGGRGGQSGMSGSSGVIDRSAKEKSNRNCLQRSTRVLPWVL